MPGSQVLSAGKIEISSNTSRLAMRNGAAPRKTSMMLFPDALLNSPLFGIGLTIILYAISEIIIDCFSLNIIPPFVIACPLVIAVIVLAPGVEYKQYEAGAEFINFLLGPATIALALPLYNGVMRLNPWPWSE